LALSRINSYRRSNWGAAPFCDDAARFPRPRRRMFWDAAPASRVRRQHLLL